jgi:hypothetical protein
MVGLPPDLRFAAALAILGVVMFSVEPQVAFWIGALLVLAALSYAEVAGSKSGHSFIGDVFAVFGGK